MTQNKIKRFLMDTHTNMPPHPQVRGRGGRKGGGLMVCWGREGESYMCLEDMRHLIQVAMRSSNPLTPQMSQTFPCMEKKEQVINARTS